MSRSRYSRALDPNLAPSRFNSPSPCYHIFCRPPPTKSFVCKSFQKTGGGGCQKSDFFPFLSPILSYVFVSLLLFYFSTRKETLMSRKHDPATQCHHIGPRGPARPRNPGRRAARRHRLPLYRQGGECPHRQSRPPGRLQPHRPQGRHGLRLPLSIASQQPPKTYADVRT
jgi:hypothetical protein